MELMGEQVADAGRKIYEGIREEMEAKHWGKLVVIDVHSGDYEVGEFVSRHSEVAITERLLVRYPDAQMWVKLVGYPAPYYMKPGRRGLYPVRPERKADRD